MSRPVALVTGASAGIGTTFARMLAARGHDLVLVARRRDRLEALAAELNAAHGVAAECLVADLSRDDDVTRVAERIRGGIDLLVNNAGFGTLGRFWETDAEAQERMIRVHVLATMRLTQAALPGMVARDRGGIINVASVAAWAPAPGNVNYSSTKEWMVRFSETLWLELKSAGSQVRVQALCPGFVYTEFHDVLGVDRARVPKGWWMQSEYVVGASLRALDRNKPIVVPSLRYKLIVLFLSYTPRWLRYRILLEYGRRLKRDELHHRRGAEDAGKTN